MSQLGQQQTSPLLNLAYAATYNPVDFQGQRRQGERFHVRSTFDLGLGWSDHFGKLRARTGIEPHGAIAALGNRSLEQDRRFLRHEHVGPRRGAV